MPSPIAVALRSVSVVRGGRTVLDDVNVSLPAGQVVGIIGPSGSGKSTMMRAIVGVQASVSGTIEVLGEPAGVASRRGAVGYLTQDLPCGLIAERSGMARPLEIISNVLPLTYAYDALRAVADQPGVSSGVLGDLAITIGMTLLALACGAATLRRRTA